MAETQRETPQPASRGEWRPLGRLEQTVPAKTILSDWKERMARHEEKALASSTPLPPELETLRVEHVVKELADQDLQGAQLEQQAQMIMSQEFMKYIIANSRNTPHALAPKETMLATIKLLNGLKPADIHMRHGTDAEADLAWNTFLRVWPPNIDLYDILREMYPAYHAQMVGQIPEFLANADQSQLLEEGSQMTNSDIKGGLPLIGGRFLGLYPMAKIPRSELQADSQFRSQDQLGRSQICENILDDASGLLAEDPGKKVTVIDYAGGVGNMTEVLMRKIAALAPGDPRRAGLLKNVKIVIREYSDGQIDGGLKRFADIEKELEEKYPDDAQDLKNMYIFVKSDVTRPMDDEQKLAVKAKFGDGYDIDATTAIGMTSYTSGALPDGVVEGMVGEVRNQCYKFYNTDFSSPDFRREDFLKDTGRAGEEYLRTMYGDTKGPELVKPLVKFMALGRGLADQYMTWPGRNGHNAGYSVDNQGNLIMPSVLSFAQQLRDQSEGGAQVDYHSNICWFSTLYNGTVKGSNDQEVAVVLVPGWVRDTFVYTNEQKKAAVK